MPAKRNKIKQKLNKLYITQKSFHRQPPHRFRRLRNQTKIIINNHNEDNPQPKHASKCQQRTSVTSASKGAGGEGSGKRRPHNSAELALRVSRPRSAPTDLLPVPRPNHDCPKPPQPAMAAAPQRCSRPFLGPPSLASHVFVSMVIILLSGLEVDRIIVLLQRKEK